MAQEQVNEQSFESLLAAQASTAWNTAEVQSNWMPPDGIYSVAFIGERHWNKPAADGKPSVFFWAPKFRIISPGSDLNDKDFSPLFRSDVMGRFKTALSIMAGGSLSADLTIVDAHRLFMAGLGAVLSVQISRTPGKGKNAGQTYTNCEFVELIQAAQAPVPTPAA
jgi:hypothetical protein